jgi:hypothetical protein
MNYTTNIFSKCCIPLDVENIITNYSVDYKIKHFVWDYNARCYLDDFTDRLLTDNKPLPWISCSNESKESYRSQIKDKCAKFVTTGGGDQYHDVLRACQWVCNTFGHIIKVDVNVGYIRDVDERIYVCRELDVVIIKGEGLIIFDPKTWDREAVISKNKFTECTDLQNIPNQHDDYGFTYSLFYTVGVYHPDDRNSSFNNSKTIVPNV